MCIKNCLLVLAAAWILWEHSLSEPFGQYHPISGYESEKECKQQIEDVFSKIKETGYAKASPNSRHFIYTKDSIQLYCFPSDFKPHS